MLDCETFLYIMTIYCAAQPYPNSVVIISNLHTIEAKPV